MRDMLKYQEMLDKKNKSSEKIEINFKAEQEQKLSIKKSADKLDITV